MLIHFTKRTAQHPADHLPDAARNPMPSRWTEGANAMTCLRKVCLSQPTVEKFSPLALLSTLPREV